MVVRIVVVVEIKVNYGGGDRGSNVVSLVTCGALIAFVMGFEWWNLTFFLLNGG